jgi:hypothetical protein
MEVGNWDDKNGGSVSPGSITVTPRNVMLTYNEQKRPLTVTCLKSNGAPDPTAAWTIEAPASWLRFSLDANSNFNSASSTLSHTGSQTVYIYTEENQTLVIRSSAFMLNGGKAGTIHQAGNYENLPGIHTPAADSYVGAFWRAEQTGERIIRITSGAYSGDWTASVVWMDANWGDGGIVLSTAKSLDPNVNSSGLTPGNAESYPVEGDDMIITGNVTPGGNLYFRIGLKSKYEPDPFSDRPARYALVLLSYNGNSKHQLIYLRQGHEADYLFRNSDPGFSRTLTKRFSPYNLTATTIDAKLDIPDAYPEVNLAKFTTFPTQPGAFFQWANNTASYIRWAYNPHSTTVSNWGGDLPGFATHWISLSTTNETCPPGYRRPYDGRIDGNADGTAANSELRQSLFQIPKNGLYNNIDHFENCMWGYYADGFFDRRSLANNGTSVAIGTNDIAHIGRLFFNSLSGSDRYGASLFLPSGGTRYPTAGGPLGDRFGKESGYWTTASDATSGGVYLRLENSPNVHVGPWYTPKGMGNMIRCVKK